MGLFRKHQRTVLLGLRMRDIVTGFEGVVTGHTNYLTGCSQLLLVPPARDGAAVEAHWFDEQRCVDVGDARIELDNGPTPGCDLAAPKR